jgi:hypothetical protein
MLGWFGHGRIRLALAVLSGACAQEPGAAAPPSAAYDAGAEAGRDTNAGFGAEAGLAADAAYARVQAILEKSCAYERCHSGAIIGGALNLTRGSDYAAALIGVPACEYERMARVAPGDPEHSWLMLKLSATVRPVGDPYADYILFQPDADWDPQRRACPDQTDDGTPLFGQRMPLTAPNRLPDDELEVVRAWIAAGARH